jgi:molecular chaperone GrpE
VTKRKKDEHDAAQPRESEETPAEPRPLPAATPDELEAASIFTDGEATAPAEAPVAEVDLTQLQAELAELRAKSDEYLDGWQRARAEFANYKKRIEREQEEGRARAAAALLTKILPVEDDLERALRDRPDDDHTRSWADGIELIQRKLAALLESEGVEIIPAEGQTFDPTLHEAVTHEESRDHREGQIIEVIQQGYRLGERVLRPARVRVAK